MDEIIEVGLYTIQLRFYNENKSSAALNKYLNNNPIVLKYIADI